MVEWVMTFLSIEGLAPHGFCLSWRPDLFWTMLISDTVIALSYFSIPCVLVYFAVKRRDLKFRWILVLFGAFIVACGTTHVIGIVTLWTPIYGLGAVANAVTAVVSFATAVVMWPLVPRALAIPSRSELERANVHLRHETQERRLAQDALQALNRDLESLIAERTKELQTSEERLKLATRVATIGVWDWDIRGDSLAWDDSMYALYGVQKEQFGSAYDAWSRTLHPDDRQSVEKDIEAALRGERQFGREFRIVRPDGAVRIIRAVSRTFYDGIGCALRIIGTNSDITETRKTEDELHEYKEHLEQLVHQRTQSLEDAMYRAEAANRAKSIFLANMSHELRTPLTSVIGFSQLMADDNGLNSDQRGKLATINRSGNHLLTLINDVLELSKIEAGRLTLDIQPASPGDLLDAVVEMLRPRAEQKALVFEVATTALPPGILCDLTKLRQVLLNLLSNGIKFTEQGRITLKVVATEAVFGSVRLDFSVSDTGPGISTEDQERVFLPFEQTGAASEQVGTGLGLSISRQYVRMMGGQLVVDSQPGRGAIFRFGFTARTCAAPTMRAAPSGAVIGIEPGSGSRRILVAEDTRDIRLLLRTLLAPLGFTVIEVTDGAAALAAVRQQAFDLVIMDWRMPEMDGIEATKCIRMAEGIRQPRIVILTASAYEEQRLATLAAGADEFLRKPFKLDEFYALLERHLGIRFLREEKTVGDSQPFAAGSAAFPTSSDLAVLSVELRRALADAVIRLNLTEVSACIARVAEDHPGLAHGLNAMVESTKFMELHRLLAT